MKLRRHPWFLRWLPVMLWMVTVFTLSSLPQQRLPDARIPHADKVAHGVAYAVGGLLVARAAANPLAAVLVPAIFGATDEWHQKSVPGRKPDIADWIADLLGTLAGVLIYQWIRARRVAIGPNMDCGGRVPPSRRDGDTALDSGGAGPGPIRLQK